MKHWIAMLAALSLATACGKDEPAEVPAETAPVVENLLEKAAAPEPADDAGDEQDDGTLQVVEESAAETDDEEQPIMLAQADPPAAARDWQFREGQHFTRLVPTQPTMGGADKIEVAEFFWYGCPHCYDFEPFINRWAENAPANVRFVRIPAMWNGILVLHARLYFTEEVLARNGVIKDPAAFRDAVFTEYHRRGNRLTSEAAIQKLFERFGVSATDFSRAWKSFEVAQKLRVAEDLARRYSISNVPAMVINGKYRTGASEAGSYPKLLEVIDELVERESLR